MDEVTDPPRMVDAKLREFHFRSPTVNSVPSGETHRH